MKMNKITAALMTVGLVSAASVANAANNTFTDTANRLGGGAGTVYEVVYVTGSTAFRTSINNILAQGNGGANAGGFFTGTGPTHTDQPNTSQRLYAGVINDGSGNHFIIDTDFTGSEAGLASLHSAAIPYPPDHSLAGAPAGNVNLPNTPTPAGFTDPATGADNISHVPDLARSDTSKTVSFSSGTALTDMNGGSPVCIIPFEWVKGNYNGVGAKSASWTDLTGIATYQLFFFLAAGHEPANYFTGKSADTQNVFLVGRNEGSGTRANTTTEAGLLPPFAFNQYVPNGCTYVADSTGNPVLTSPGTPVWPAGSPHSLGIGFEGFDSGGTVATALSADSSVGTFITLAYLGLSDAGTAITGHGLAITLDGKSENDGNVINGSYAFWGYEHLYGQVSPSGDATQAANNLLAQVSSFFGTQTWPDANQDLAIDPNAMNANRPGLADTGYPTQ